MMFCWQRFLIEKQKKKPKPKTQTHSHSRLVLPCAFWSKRFLPCNSFIPMAYILLPNLSHHTFLLHHHPSKDKPPLPFPLLSPPPHNNPPSSSSSSLFIHHPPSAAAAATAAALASQDSKQHNHWDDFFVNVGLAVRTLRQDLPLLFSKDLDYHIYRYPPPPFSLFLHFYCA